MNEILDKMISRMHVGKMYNPAAPYVRRRKLVVEWMCEVGEELKYQPEAIHHSIALFDSYYSIPGIKEIQESSIIGPAIQGKSDEQVI